MLESPGHWRNYYEGDPQSLFVQRHFSYSDRIRYYWPDRQAGEAVERVFARLEGRTIPPTLAGQYLPLVPRKGDARETVLSAVANILRRYDRACEAGSSKN